MSHPERDLAHEADMRRLAREQLEGEDFGDEEEALQEEYDRTLELEFKEGEDDFVSFWEEMEARNEL